MSCVRWTLMKFENFKNDVFLLRLKEQSMNIKIKVSNGWYIENFGWKEFSFFFRFFNCFYGSLSLTSLTRT